MVNLEYVKKKRRKKVIAIAGAATACIVTSFAVMAFIGTKLGDYTTNLKNNGVDLALSEEEGFLNPTTYLRVEKLPAFEVFSAEWFDSSIRDGNFVDSKVDSSNTNYLDLASNWWDSTGDGIENERSIWFFKYTFFIKNVGLESADYDFELTIPEQTKDVAYKYSLDDVIRVRLFENDMSAPTVHTSETFAKKSNYSHPLHDSVDVTDKECIWDDNNNKTDFCPEDTFTESKGYETTSFLDSKTVCKRTITDFKADQAKRYTVVIWLEGSDPECDGDKPVGMSLKFASNIDARKHF